MIKMEKNLFDAIYDVEYPWDAIVVEGYDGVGKGKLLSTLSSLMHVTPYRPDYSFWQQYEHHQPDRWKISGFFWDIFSHFMHDRVHTGTTLLFDRGVISGAVYNKDESIARNYSKLLRGMRVLHILVTCSEEDYYKFAEVRGCDEHDKQILYKDYQEYTSRYHRYLELAGVDYLIYENHYDPELAGNLAETCGGCGHYSYGVCKNPKVAKAVDSYQPRCEHSTDEEVQDADDRKMQCV